MPASETRSDLVPRYEAVLTLPEVAVFLRVDEGAILQLLADRAIPGQTIGGEWRFSRAAIEGWLRHDPRSHAEMWMPHPFWFLEDPLSEKLLQMLERRVTERLAVEGKTHVGRGSKEAVLDHFGIFRDDDDLDERLADAKARRATQ